MVPTIDTMMEVGMHLGYSRTRRHPSTKPFLFGTRQDGDIINLEKSVDQWQVALEFLKAVASSGRQILFVGSKPEARETVSALGVAMGAPYVERRWIGGTLTNWTEVKRRLELLEKMEADSIAGTLVYKTKKEKLMLERKLEKLKKNFQGIRTLRGTPGAIVVIDPKNEEIAVTEGNKTGVPVVALLNTDCNIAKVAYPVIGNDGSKGTIKLFIDSIQKTLQG